MWRKSSGFRVSPLTLRCAPFRVSRVGKPKPSGAPGEPPGTGPRPAAGSEPGVTGWPEADRHGGPGTDRGAPGHAGTGAWRGLSDTTCDGWNRTTSTWPRGAGAVSAVRLLGAASRPDPCRPGPRHGPVSDGGGSCPPVPSPWHTGPRRRRRRAHTRVRACCGRCRTDRRWRA